MRKWISILLNILVWLLPPGGTAVVVILAWLRQVPWYLIALSAIATIVLILLGINQFALFRQRHQKGLSKRTDKEIENIIREWVDIPGFTFKRLDVDGNEVYFDFMVTDQVDRPVHIIRMRKNPYYILIWADISIDPKPDMQEKLTEGELKKLVGKLSLEMLRLGCGYEFRPMGNGFCIRLYHTVLIDDSLTAITFRLAGAYITRAFTLVMGIIGLTLEELGINVPVYYKKDSQP